MTTTNRILFPIQTREAAEDRARRMCESLSRRSRGVTRAVVQVPGGFIEQGLSSGWRGLPKTQLFDGAPCPVVSLYSEFVDGVRRWEAR